jgi:2-phosphosulfolactate phosphatase
VSEMTTPIPVPTERAAVFVHLLPSLIPPGSLSGVVVVVVDVLRATTVMVHALAAGCEAVIPCGEIDEAKAVAAGLPAGTALLAGERGGLPIPGFDLGNSPGDFTPEVCTGKTLVMTTTNGTRAILASLEAERVYIASFANLRATSDEIAVQFLKKDHGHPVHIVCSGTEGFISLEDSLLAGALIRNLARRVRESTGERIPIGNDEALMAEWQWLGASEYELASAQINRLIQTFRESIRGRLPIGDHEAPLVEQWSMAELAFLGASQFESLARPLSELLESGRGGQNVSRIGLGPDIAAAAQVDGIDLVAELSRDPLRIVAV